MVMFTIKKNNWQGEKHSFPLGAAARSLYLDGDQIFGRVILKDGPFSMDQRIWERL